MAADEAKSGKDRSAAADYLKKPADNYEQMLAAFTRLTGTPARRWLCSARFHPRTRSVFMKKAFGLFPTIIWTFVTWWRSFLAWRGG